MMMRFVSVGLASPLRFVVFLLALGANAHGVDVGGPVVSNTTWTAAQSPYVVTSAVIIGANATLTIEPGVVVKFNQGLGITVGSQAFGAGTLKVVGTQANPVRFTSNSPNGQPGQWKDILFSDFAIDAAFDAQGGYTGGSILRHCIVEFAGSGAAESGCVTISRASPFIDSCEVRFGSKSGIYATSNGAVPIPPRLRIVNSFLHHNGAVSGSVNGGGAYLSIANSGVLFRGNTVSQNVASVSRSGGGLNAVLTASTFDLVEIVDNSFEGNSTSNGGAGAGAYIQLAGGSIAPMEVGGNSFSANTCSAGGPGAGLYLGVSSTQVTCAVSGNTFTDNDTPNGSGAGVFVEASAFGGVLSINGNLFAANSAREGGGVSVSTYGQNGASPSQIVCSSNAFIGNQAVGSGSGDGVGGAMMVSQGFFWPTILTIDDTTFIANSAIGGPLGGLGRGGALFLSEGNPTYPLQVDLAGDASSGSRNTFVDNEADLGTAIYNNLEYRKDGTNDIAAQYICWGGLDPNPTANPNLIYDFFDNPQKAFVIYPPHVEGDDCSKVSDCGPGFVADCNGNCAPASWIGDGICDNGSYSYNGQAIFLDCAQFADDGGDCARAPALPEPAAHTPPPQPTYVPPPPPAPVEKNCVVLIHGRKTDSTTFNQFWKPMASDIDAQLGPDWKVFAHDWTAKSEASVFTVLTVAASEGWALGKQLADAGYEHVHLIGHSAGAAAISAAAFRIKHPDGNPLSTPSSTTVHTTYLDAYMGVLEGVFTDLVYGQFSDWSDHYYSREPAVAQTLLCYGTLEDPLQSFGCSTYGFTQTPILASHNVDVSFLDEVYSFLCKSNHTWPRCFYRYSIPGYQPFSAGWACGDWEQVCNAPEEPFAPYGFGLSKETLGANWLNTVQEYRAGENVVLGNSGLDGGTEDPSPEFVLTYAAPLAIATLPYASGPANAVTVAGSSFTASTAGTPAPGSAWITLQLTPTATTNTVAFNLAMTSGANAQGVLSVYVDGVEVGLFDERYVPIGGSTQSVELPEPWSVGSTHTLSFRVDQFGSTPSVASIQSVRLGFGGFSVLGDLDLDGAVGATDIAILLGAWGGSGIADLDGDGVVGSPDLAILLGAWTT